MPQVAPILLQHSGKSSQCCRQEEAASEGTHKDTKGGGCS